MKINKYPHEIYEIEDFISDEEIREILDQVNLIDDEGWGSNNSGFKIPGNAVLSNLEHKIVQSFYNVTRCVSIQDVKRLKVGEVINAHIDQSEPDLMWGAIVYLNDNYKGGEIEYPELDFKLKPKKGSMVVHQSINLHHVLPVLDGIRYMATTFLFGDETTVLKLN